MKESVCPVCGSMLRSDGFYFDCPLSGQDKGSAYEPHRLNPFTQRETKIKTRDMRVTTEGNIAMRALNRRGFGIARAGGVGE